MTLNLARNFLLIPWHNRIEVLRELHALDEDEINRLIKSNHTDEINWYQVAFRRITERKQLGALEVTVQKYLQS